MSSVTESTAPSMVSLWVGRVMSALPSLLLISSASMKLAKPPMIIEGFQKLGYPTEILTGLGIVELLCAILYIIPQTAVLGAILVTGYLGGAISAHVRLSEPFIPVAVFGMLVWGGLYLRDRRIRALLPLRRLR